MSPFRRQSAIFLQSALTEVLISEPFSINGIVSSAFQEETFGPPAFPTDHLLPSFEDDHLGPPPTQSGDGERVNFFDFAANICDSSFGARQDMSPNLAHQATYRELSRTNRYACSPADITTMYEAPPPRPTTMFTHTLSTSLSYLPTGPVDPSTTTIYPFCFDPDPHASPLDNTAITSPSTTNPSLSSLSGSSGSEGDGYYILPSDDDGKGRQTQSNSSRRQKKSETTREPKSPRRTVPPPPRSTSSKSEENDASSRSAKCSRPYSRSIPSRNFQCEDAALFIDNGSNSRCPVVGCEYGQKNHHIPNLKRHIETHTRWREPEKWMCCGVGVDRAKAYGKGIRQGMTDEECIVAGAYMFRGRLMIGGCLKTFARRDALKRHVDNLNIPCIGHMDSYDF